MSRIRLTRPRLLVLALALAAAFTIAACGGDSGGDEDPQEVLEATFNNEDADRQRGLRPQLRRSPPRVATTRARSRPASAGPSRAAARAPSPSSTSTAEADLDSSAQDFSGSAGHHLHRRQGLRQLPGHRLRGAGRALPAVSEPPSSRPRPRASSRTTSGNFLSSIGINPSNWLTDLSNEGNEDVEGTETIHISGQADVPKLVEDIRTIAERVPQAADQVTPAQLSQLDELTDIIKSADFDIYTGADDDILRKLEANLEIDPPDADSGAPESVSVGFSVTLSELNEPQEISGPTDAQPLGDLLQQFGVDPSQLGALGAAGGRRRLGLRRLGRRASPATQAYLDCLADGSGPGRARPVRGPDRAVAGRGRQASGPTAGPSRPRVLPLPERLALSAGPVHPGGGRAGARPRGRGADLLLGRAGGDPDRGADGARDRGGRRQVRARGSAGCSTSPSATRPS